MTSKPLRIGVIGAGITGLWQACELAYRGHIVDVVECSATPFSNAASQHAGAMLAPYCERDGAEPLIQELGLRGLEHWQNICPSVTFNGTLVVAQARDRNELARFGARTEGHSKLDTTEIAALEPDLQGRFQEGLLFASEGFVDPSTALMFLLNRARRLGVTFTFASLALPPECDYVIDCRGVAAGRDLPSLRGVRGERAVVRTNDVCFNRTIRLLHPRFPLYAVPWGSGVYMLGATVIESADTGPVTLRSTLDLLGLAYALHPAFGEARVLSLDASVRPAFPDNLPKIIVKGRRVHVNGLYRHGFLLAPVLAETVADWIEERPHDTRLFLDGDDAQTA